MMAYIDPVAGANRESGADDVFTQAANVAALGALTASAPAALTVGAALTDNSGGTANDTVQDLGAVYAEAEVANNFADVVAKLNALIADVTALRTNQAAIVTDQGTIRTKVNAILTAATGAGKPIAAP
jgi:hypothetical protein